MQDNSGEFSLPDNSSTLIVAEIGFNHAGDLRLAQEMINQAAKCGVQAVKFQSFHTGELHLPENPLFRELQHAELDLQAHKQLHQTALDLGVTFFSTPFSPLDVSLLEETGVAVYKIASMDLNNPVLLREVARTQKPILLSTGMAKLTEIEQALNIISRTGHKATIILLHCISMYPTCDQHAQLQFIPLLKDTFALPTGFSDHTQGIEIALGAVALGACVLEKHFTTDKGLPGPDHQLALDPGEMQKLVMGIRRIEQARGNKNMITKRPDTEQAPLLRRGLYTRESIAAGTRLAPDMIKAVRPERGLSVACWDDVLGRRVTQDLTKDQPLTWDVLE